MGYFGTEVSRLLRSNWGGGQVRKLAQELVEILDYSGPVTVPNDVTFGSPTTPAGRTNPAVPNRTSNVTYNSTVTNNGPTVFNNTTRFGGPAHFDTTPTVTGPNGTPVPVGTGASSGTSQDVTNGFFFGKVVSGSGSSYQADIDTSIIGPSSASDDPLAASNRVQVNIFSIDPTETIDPGYPLVIFRKAARTSDGTLVVAYFAQPPTWAPQS